MLDWFRKRDREDQQLEKIVDDIENPAEPDLASAENLGPSAKNAMWAVAIAAVVVIVVAAVWVLSGLHFGRPV